QHGASPLAVTNGGVVDLHARGQGKRPAHLVGDVERTDPPLVLAVKLRRHDSLRPRTASLTHTRSVVNRRSGRIADLRFSPSGPSGSSHTACRRWRAAADRAFL